jgi:tetratricopeptide (TPR) repeat protein
MGNCKFTAGRFEEALQYYKNALKADPSFVDAEYNCGLALKELKKYDDALSYFERLNKRLPQNTQIMLQMSKLNALLASSYPAGKGPRFFICVVLVYSYQHFILKNREEEQCKLLINGCQQLIHWFITFFFLFLYYYYYSFLQMQMFLQKLELCIREEMKIRLCFTIKKLIGLFLIKPII